MVAKRRQLKERPFKAAAPDVAAALRAAGSPQYLSRLIDSIGRLAPHDRVTVTRYSTQAAPQFLTHRNFADELVARYLDIYYPYDPFYAYWCEKEQVGVVPLRQFSSRELKQGLYIAEFLYQSVIRDEVGVFLDDGPQTTLAVFLERSSRNFSRREIGNLERAFPLIAAVHGVHRRLVSPEASRNESARGVPRKARWYNGKLPCGLWPELTAREREIVALVLTGHPSSKIADRLRISSGTVRIHRHNIYGKLDITTEREVFLQYIEFVSQAG